MNTQPTAMERAFELAKSGTVSTIDDIRSKLRSEGLDHLQIQGPSLLKQLRAMIADSQT